MWLVTKDKIWGLILMRTRYYARGLHTLALGLGKVTPHPYTWDKDQSWGANCGVTWITPEGFQDPFIPREPAGN